MKTIKFIKSPVSLGFGYHVGESGKFEEEKANELIEKGFAIEVKEEANNKTKGNKK